MTGSIHVNTEPGAKTVFDTIRIPIEMFKEEGLRQTNKIFSFLISSFSEFSEVGYFVISETEKPSK